MRSKPLHWRDVHKTTSFRLTLLMGSVATTGVVLLLLLIYFLIARDLNERSDHVLRAEAARLAGVSSMMLPAEITRSIRENAGGLNYLGLIGSDHRFIAGNLQLHGMHPLNKPFEVDALLGVHHSLRIFVLRTADGNFLVIGRDIAPLVDLRKQIGRILMLSALLILPLLLIAGVLLSMGPLKRLNALQRVARTIATGELEARMPIKGKGDELDLFAATVNQMVEAVEQTVAQVKSVTDAIAHDLRTPLTHVRNQLYRISRDEALPPDHTAKIQQSIEDLDFVVDRFAALMRISELESAKQAVGFTTCFLSDLATTVTELYEPLAEEKHIQLSVVSSSDAQVLGHEKLLFEAISNLVDNAIKFTPVGGFIIVSVSALNAEVLLEVRDNGPGVPVELREAILRRFDRGAASPHLPGSGLGLSIVAAIVNMHRFTLEFASADPGFVVRIRTPKA